MMRFSLSFFAAFAFLILFSASCSRNLEPGFYRVAGKDSSSGILQVKEDRSGVYYQNENRLVAQPVSVSPKKRSLLFPDGRKVKVSVSRYTAPEFRVPEGSSPYRKSKYDVQVDTNVVYGQASGYWTSYPDSDEPFGLIYVRKFGKLVGRKIKSIILPRQRLDLTMDIYTPVKDRSRSRPLLMLIHGGSFFNGDKAGVDSDMVRWARHFASLGYVVSSINYRMGFLVTSEGERAGYRALQDANAAIRFLLQDTLNLNINPGLIFVAGESSGAITALNLAYMTEKYRPRSTEGLFLGHIGNEGKIDKITPPPQKPFQIRAVGSLWGAVSDTMMLQNAEARVPVISFHSEDDATVPFASGRPLQSVNKTIEKINQIVDTGEDLINGLFFEDEVIDIPELSDIFFTEMHGSSVVDRILHRKGIRSELHSFKGDRHRLHLRDMKIDEENFALIQNEMEAFFSSEMVDHPVMIVQDLQDKQRFYISPESSKVEECYWKVEGGFIIDKNFNSVRIILKPDDAVHSLTVSGIYKDSGLAFTETYVIE